MWRSARSTSCSRLVAVCSCASASRSSRPIASLSSTTASSSSTRRARAYFEEPAAASTSCANVSARVSSSRNSRLNASNPAPSSTARASPAFTNCPLAIQSPFNVTYISPVAIDLTIASSRFAAMRAFIFCGSVRWRTVTSCCGAPRRSEMRRSSRKDSVWPNESAGRSSRRQVSAVSVSTSSTSSLPPCNPATRKLARPPLFSRNHWAARTASAGVGTTIDCKEDPSTPSTARSHFASTFNASASVPMK